MQNLREAIASYRNRLYYEPSDSKKASLLHVCLEYLERCGLAVSERRAVERQSSGLGGLHRCACAGNAWSGEQTASKQSVRRYPSDSGASLLHLCLKRGSPRSYALAHAVPPACRYYVLIAFAAYLCGPSFQPGRWGH